MCLNIIADTPARRNTLWASGLSGGRLTARLGIERVIFVNDAAGITIEFCRGNRRVAVTGMEQSDADHQSAGEAPGVTLSDGE